MAVNQRVQIIGLEELTEDFAEFKRKFSTYLVKAGEEAGEDVILITTGLRQYPPTTAANQPPPPYYVRGLGTAYSGGGNSYSSEQLNEQWTVSAQGDEVTLKNAASYAKWIHGEDTQVGWAGDRGWKKVLTVAKRKMNKILDVYEAWINVGIRDSNLDK